MKNKIIDQLLSMIPKVNLFNGLEIVDNSTVELRMILRKCKELSSFHQPIMFLDESSKFWMCHILVKYLQNLLILERT